MLDKFVFLYGSPGSGKSELGRRLAQTLEAPFYDLDGLIEAHAGRPIPEIFTAQGESEFRRLESAELLRVCAETPGVVALGGGALLRLENRLLVERAGQVLLLTASFTTLEDRLGKAPGTRPLLGAGSAADATARLARLLEQRAAHYASFREQLDTESLSPEESAWRAQVRLGVFRLQGMGGGYDVCAAAGGLTGLSQALRRRGLNGPLALVTDENVARFHLEAVQDGLRADGYAVQSVIIPAGEQYKTVDTLVRLWDAFLQAGLERGSTVVALGGGVVGDLAGFAAATYLRGVRWVCAPTTLLAMVDAGLGGKTGADLPQGKNLVGAFYPPALVLADPLVLGTLPEAEIRNGLAEVVKHGVIADPQLFELCASGRAALDGQWERVVRRGMAVKVRVIEEDPYERGRRAALNLGHSLGHALELASNFSLKHGEAVAIGMVQAARLAEQRALAETGLAEQIRRTLQSLGLPVNVPPGLDRQRILAGMRVDKKRSGGRLRAVLPVRIGEVRWGVELEDPIALLDVVSAP